MREPKRKVNWCKRCNQLELAGNEKECWGEQVCLECKLIEDIHTYIETLINLRAKKRKTQKNYERQRELIKGISDNATQLKKLETP
jgi:hypothetical protein